jgi:hypothetical protein
VRAALVALLFVVACKEESKPAPAAAKDTPASADTQARPRPQLPEGPRPEGTEDPANRWDRRDPALREEIREKIEERRKNREAMLDTNHDGVVSDEERQQRLKPMVERLDANGDGKLTPDELAQSDRRMGFDDPAAVDTNKDGEISLAELDAAITARREKMRERWRGGGPPRVPGGEP